MRLAEIVARLGGELLGDPDVPIRRVATLQSAGPGDLSFLTQPKYRPQLRTTRAAAIVLSKAERDATALPRILCEDPYLYFARVAQLFAPGELPAPGIHAGATVEEGASVAPTATVEAGAYVARGVRLGERARVGAGCVVAAGVEIGEDSRLYPLVSVYEGSSIGKRVLIHSGVVIGADGFGLAREGERWIKIPQVGRVIIGDDVEIGANTTIDRGALDDTVIEEGVKLDNQIQIGHNVRIGAHTVIAGCAGIAGSARIGRNCMIGGAAMIHGHIEIADGVVISAATLITKSIHERGTYTGALPSWPNRDWARNIAHLRHLDELADRVRELEKQLAQSQRRKSR